MYNKKEEGGVREKKPVWKCPSGVCGWEACDVSEVLGDPDEGNVFCPCCRMVMIEGEGE